MQISPDAVARVLADEQRRFAATHPTSARLAADAAQHLIGGVPMAWMTRLPGGYPVFFERAAGAHVVDVDGNDYVDFCLGDTGAMTGHAIDAVTSAVAARAAQGITTMLPSTDAAWVGEELARRFGLPLWQMAMTATDANRFVLRLARAVTGRPKVLVFDWCYHGTVDEALVVRGPDGAAMPRPGSLGPPVDPALTTVVVPFNDVDALAAALAVGDVAAVLAEPALTNIGIVAPEPGFHDALRELTRQHGALLVLDETHTICCGPGGATAAWGLDPDLLVIGKPIGGGVPAAAYGMTHAVHAALAEAFADDSIDVSGVGGTLTGNALALAAVRATLTNCLRADDFAMAIPLAEEWADGVRDAYTAAGLTWHVQQLGSRAEYWYSRPPRDGAAAAAAVRHDLDELLHLWCFNRGVLLTPFHNMALLSPHHTSADVARHTDVFAEALAALA